MLVNLVRLINFDKNKFSIKMTKFNLDLNTKNSQYSIVKRMMIKL